MKNGVIEDDAGLWHTLAVAFLTKVRSMGEGLECQYRTENLDGGPS